MLKRTVIFIFMVVLFVFPMAVKAWQPSLTEEPPTPAVLQDAKLLLAHISIWPEYASGVEKPGELNALVINRYVVDPQGVQFPVRVRIKVPATGIELRTVAVGESPESASDQGVEFSISAADEGWADLFVNIWAPAIRVEYYDYNIAREGVSREYTYKWPGTYPVGTFRVDVRVPLQATNMRSVPDASLTGTDAEGFKFGEMSVPDMTAGKTFELKINYDREIDQPSTTLIQVTPAAPLAEPAEQPAQAQASEPYGLWILAGFALGLLAAVYWFSTRRSGSSRRHK